MCRPPKKISLTLDITQFYLYYTPTKTPMHNDIISYATIINYKYDYLPVKWITYYNTRASVHVLAH